MLELKTMLTLAFLFSILTAASLLHWQHYNKKPLVFKTEQIHPLAHASMIIDYNVPKKKLPQYAFVLAQIERKLVCAICCQFIHLH
jgi:hypothetical protein